MLLPTCPDLKAIRELIVSPYLRSQVQVLFSLNFMLWNSFPFHNLKNNHSSGWHRWNCYDKFEHNFLWFWCLRTSDLSVMKTSNITKKYDLDLFSISETRGLHNFHKILSDNKQVNDFNLSFLGKFSSLAENAFFFLHYHYLWMIPAGVPWSPSLSRTYNYARTCFIENLNRPPRRSQVSTIIWDIIFKVTIIQSSFKITKDIRKKIEGMGEWKEEII